MTEACEALYGRDERPGEQALCGVLAVPGDVVVDDLVVGGGAVAPVQHLLAGGPEGSRRLAPPWPFGRTWSD